MDIVDTDPCDSVIWLRNKYSRHGELEDKLAADEITTLRQQVAKLQAGISEYDQLVTVSNSRIVDLQKNLAIAIEALELICNDWSEAEVIATEALNKIRGE